MSEQENQPPAPPKRRRTPRTKAEGRNHPAPQAGAAVPVSPPAPPSSAASAEPPVGEKWGEFPPVERQAKLKRMLGAWGQERDHGGHPGPFAEFKLTGADVYWLAALLTGGDIIAGRKELITNPPTLSNLHLEGADLGGAHLEGANLHSAHLEGADLGGAYLEGARLAVARLEGAHLIEAYLEGADLAYAHLVGAELDYAHLENASLYGAYLEGASLYSAYLEGTDLNYAHLEGVDLRGVRLDVKTRLTEAQFDASILVADVTWNGVPLFNVGWEQVLRLGDEVRAHQARWSDAYGEINLTKDQRRDNYQVAARAYSQLAIVLRGQGITDAADRFTYRALIMQRKALWWQLKGRKFSMLGSYLFSLFLAVLTGYGFRMWRIIAAYILLILAFAGAYWSLDLQTPHIYTFWQALILSVTAFHGRVFSNPFLLTEPQIVVTAIEAIFGLVIEGVFIAMLTQRFFNR